MSTLFSFAFTALFLTFIVVAVVGHVLLVQALVRPFFASLSVANRRAAVQDGMLPSPTR